MAATSFRRTLPLAAAVALVVSTIAAGAAAAEPKPRDPDTSVGTPVDLGVLFVGAHPDDEASTLSTYGQWLQSFGAKTGVVTITRGEGGGNAVGVEEGPALGLLREDEERRAVAKAGITDIFNLDEVDFYYTVSQPLTRQVWGHQDVLGKLVRIIRTTKPEVITTMNPAPTPGQHGNHQEAARLAVEAYHAAGDPTQFPDQIRREGLKAFAPSRLLVRASWGTGANGPDCAGAFVPADPTQNVYGAWGGVTAPDGRTWAAVERDAQRVYASQGWAGFPDVATDPAQLGCDYFTQIASRTPFPAPGTAAAAASSGALDGALVRSPGTVPLGTGFEVTTSAYRVVAGTPFTATVSVTAPAGGLTGVTIAPKVPDGWTISGNGDIGRAPAGAVIQRVFTVIPAAGTPPETAVRITATLTSQQGTGYSDAPVKVSPPVSVRQQYLPQVAQYVDWARTVKMDAFVDIVQPVLTVPSGKSRSITYTATNNTTTSQTALVNLALPNGFTADTSSWTVTVPAAGQASQAVTVTNSDPTLPTSNQGGAAGDYLYSITVTTAGTTSSTRPALEIVPSTVIPQATTAPVVDGVIGPDEYPGPTLDVSRRWEGTACSSAADCSATAKLAWSADTLYVAVTVVDDIKGTPLLAADCKRHWRTDSVEIAIDPRGTSENTSTTFKLAVLPWTVEDAPCYLRDADNHQGDGPAVAPGVTIASTVTSPYTGYTIEVAIPMAELPGAIDPNRMGLNILPYDSDTQDKTGQTRIGWSVWGGVQGDPYRWGIATLPGYVPPAGRPTTAPEPVMPLEALASADSPQSIEQAVRNNVALAGNAASSSFGWVDKARSEGGAVLARIRSNAPGTVHVFVRDSAGTAGSVVTKTPAGKSDLRVPLSRALQGAATVYLAWVDAAGATVSSQQAVR